MIAAGYLAKRVAAQPDWLKAAAVSDICSVSCCISEAFCDYIRYWKHNGYWLFDSPALVEEVARSACVDLSEHRLFYYEVYERQFDEERDAWEPFGADPAFPTSVQVPPRKRLLGFDVVSFNARTSPECSPLSCNHLAQSIPVNQHCLLESLDNAKKLLEGGAFNGSEPGPFRIFAVYSQCGFPS